MCCVATFAAMIADDVAARQISEPDTPASTNITHDARETGEKRTCSGTCEDCKSKHEPEPGDGFVRPAAAI